MLFIDFPATNEAKHNELFLSKESHKRVVSELDGSLSMQEMHTIFVTPLEIKINYISLKIHKDEWKIYEIFFFK